MHIEKGIKYALQWRLMPVFVVSLLFMTLWSLGIFVWRAHFSGVRRATSLLSNIRSAEQVLEEKSKLKVQWLGELAEAGRLSPSLLASDETLIVGDASGGFRVWGGELKGERSLLEDRSFVRGLSNMPDWYVHRGRLFHVSPSRLIHSERFHRLYLVHESDDRFARSLSEALGSEIEFYAGSHATGTSWVDAARARVVPALSVRTESSLLALRDNETISERAEYEVPNYRGYAGQDRFVVYHAFQAIRNAQGQAIGYRSAILPESALLMGFDWATKGSLVIFVLLTLFGAVVIRRTSEKLLAPLTATVEEVYDLSNRIAEAHGLIDHSEDGRIIFDVVRDMEPGEELAALRAAVTSLRKELEHAAHMVHIVDIERARSLESARLANVGELAAKMAHEINNPVAIIYGRAEDLRDAALKGKLDPERAAKALDVIASTSLRISSIVRGLRAAARDGASDAIEEASVPEIVRDVQELCRARSRRSGALFTVGPIPHDLIVSCRPVQIVQVLANLLANAFDAVEGLSEKWIRLEVRANATGGVAFVVTDSGRGIPDELRNKIMRPFFTTKGRGKGTGLGLSLSRDIVESYGGRIDLDVRNAHTCFVVSLPGGESSDRVAA